MKKEDPNRTISEGLSEYKKTGKRIAFRLTRARDGIRTRDPRLGKAILHH